MTELINRRDAETQRNTKRLFLSVPLRLCGKKWLFMILLLIGSCVSAEAGIIAERIMTLEPGTAQASDVAVNKRGDIYILDGLNGRVAVFDSKGNPLSVFGELNLPMAIEVQGERVYVSDTGNSRILVFTEDGRFLNKIELPKLSEPTGLLVQDNTVIWSDRKSHKVCRTSLVTGKTMACWGGKGEEEGRFLNPLMIEEDRDGYLYVVDVLNARVQYFNWKGSYSGSVSRFGTAPGTLFRPHGVAVGAGDRVFISDSYTGRVSIFRNDAFEGVLSGPDGKELIYDAAGGIAASGERLYVTGIRSGKVEVFRLIEKKGGESRQTGEIPSRKNCVTCHASWSTDYKQDDREKTSSVLPEASLRMCDSCHNGNVIDSRTALGKGHQHPDIHHEPKEKEKIKERREERGDKTPKEFPLVNNNLYCGSCHTPHNREKNEKGNAWMRVSAREKDVCIGCHKSYAGNIARTNHPIGISLSAPPPGADKKLYASSELLQKGLPDILAKKGGLLDSKKRMVCQTCHGIHGTEEEDLLLMKNGNAALCTTCHADIDALDRKDARKKGIHPVNMELEKPGRIGEREVRKITCLTCHSVHKGRRGTPSLVDEYADGSLCSRCHKKEKEVTNTDHDLRFTARTSMNRLNERPVASGVCGVCHTMHRGKKGVPFLYASRLESYSGTTPLGRDRLCFDCHRKKGIAEKKWVEHFTHPYKDLVLRSRTSVFPLYSGEWTKSEFGNIKCVTCHDPHRWSSNSPSLPLFGKEEDVKANREGTVLNSFLRRNGVKDTFCVDCHGMETRAKYRYYHDKKVRDEGIDYIK